MEILSIQLLFIANGKYILVIYAFTSYYFYSLKFYLTSKCSLIVFINNDAEYKNKFLFSVNYRKRFFTEIQRRFSNLSVYTNNQILFK